jgi:hypothetical protein
MAAERKFRDAIDNSPYVAVQRQRLRGMLGAVVRCKVPPDEARLI